MSACYVKIRAKKEKRRKGRKKRDHNKSEKSNYKNKIGEIAKRNQITFQATKFSIAGKHEDHGDVICHEPGCVCLLSFRVVSFCANDVFCPLQSAKILSRLFEPSKISAGPMESKSSSIAIQADPFLCARVLQF